MKPYRFKIERKAGWHKPAGGIIVARPTKWGNPYKLGPRCTRAQMVSKYEARLAAMPEKKRHEFLAPLHGKPLGCWCALDEPCHADVLLKWANR